MDREIRSSLLMLDLKDDMLLDSGNAVEGNVLCFTMAFLCSSVL